MSNIQFEISEHICVLGTTKSGWTKELNKVSWNGHESKYDLREWDPEHLRMGKGITLTNEEMQLLLKAFTEK